ncbi:MAG: DUF1080 domain-containing protein [Balneolaceae bacterium]|nr:DUF1080 domain-containing protein [Balneolaceae bacterium]
MKQIITITALLIINGACSSQSNEMSETEEQNTVQNSGEWIVLFDGSNTDHWRSYNSDSFPEVGWTVQDDMLVFEPPVNDGAEGGHNLITKEKYTNFHLQLDWRIEEGSNSGIFYGVLEQDDIDIYWSGPEYQILDPDVFEEMNEDTRKRVSGALYDLVEPNPKNMNPIGEWNNTEIIVDGSTVIHRLNGETVVEIERWTPEWFEMIRNSKFANHNEFGNVREGHIGIQDHGGPVMIRNVQIKEL